MLNTRFRKKVNRLGFKLTYKSIYNDLESEPIEMYMIERDGYKVLGLDLSRDVPIDYKDEDEEEDAKNNVKVNFYLEKQNPWYEENFLAINDLMNLVKEYFYD